MKIPRYSSSRIGKAYLRPAPVANRRSSIPGSKKKDEVILSSRAQEVRRLTELAKGIPAVRQEKVEAIKKQIESGTYEVSSQTVAKSIIDLHRKIYTDSE